MTPKRKPPVSATDDTWEQGDPRSLVGAQVEVVSAIPETDVCTLRLRLPSGEHCYLTAAGSVLFLTVKAEND